MIITRKGAYFMNKNILKLESVVNEVKKAVIGKDEVIELVMAAIIAGGHILLEDIPGVGKTTMAMSFSKAMELYAKRMQFTPDVLPTDVVGYNMPTEGGKFEYVPGAVVCNLFLADEINRTSPKTQSALLEVMEEGKISVDGVTRVLPKPFVVIATQNPTGSIGTHLLPDSQLDRFMIKLSVGYPDIESEITMLKNKKSEENEYEIQQVISKDELVKIREEVTAVHMSDEVLMYITQLSNASRNSEYIKLGLSPRGTIALASMAQAMAYYHNRDYVLPEDVRVVFPYVVGHRIVPSAKAKVNNMSIEDIIKVLIDEVKSEEFSSEK